MAVPGDEERLKTVEEIVATRGALTSSSSKDPNTLKATFFKFMDGLSILLVAYYKSDGLHGWTQGVIFSDGNGLSAEDGEYIEQIFSNNGRFLEILKKGEGAVSTTQEGGAGKLTLKARSFMGKAKAGIIDQNPSDDKFPFSIDEGIGYVASLNTKLDNQVRAITDQIGPTAFINKLPTDPFIPVPFIGKIQFPKYAILPLLDAILETMRLTTIFMPFDIPAFRKIISVTKAIFEISDGNWRQAILSFVGYFSQAAGRASSMAKIVMQAWMMIDPSISNKIALYTYKGVKSMFITFWLSIFQIVSPDFIWMPIGKFLENINGLIDSSQQGIDKLSETFTAQLQGMGYTDYTVKLPTIEGIMGLPDAGGRKMEFSFDDLQNIQALLTMPFFICSTEGQAIIKEMVKTPARIVLELLNIPTSDSEFKEICNTDQVKSLGVTIANSVTKGISIEKMAGGFRRKTRRRDNKKQKKTHRRRHIRL